MSVVGLLLSVGEDDFSEFEGNVETLEVKLSIRVWLIPESERKGANYPTHRISAIKPSAREIQIGSAWLKKAKVQAHSGDYFLSMTLDDPSLPGALNLTAFRRARSTEWDIVWQRPRSVRPVAAE